ncbi:glycoside hydrolase family 13 protein [uncultured Clostridium sp.]|uniref:glycoside hydrolase family 13 protein n=1 Tax=uncultured Clostridium sp. TaxID=59620 RepID=UPI0025FC8BAA|nr:glycoside hydrolase family 13 protein [uncultured Clostridium sp.]
MNKYAVYHVTEAPYSYAKDINTLTLRVRAANDDIKKCIVYYKDKYLESSPYDSKEMDLAARCELFDYFQTDISVFRNRYQYYFKIIDNDGNEAYLTERGVKEDESLIYPYIFPYIAAEDVYDDVKWMQESVVYQIFPERFCNGDASINPQYITPWGEEDNLTYYSRYGGDIRGIINKLDYIKDLGVDIIYLTPIFQSKTAHKYDTSDYFNIDPQFGTVETMKELVDKTHKKGMKIILDAVFNHSGEDFFAFKDVLENQQDSKYKDWYFIDSYPVLRENENYYTFGHRHFNMPKLNTSNEEVKEYLLKVGEYWVKEIGIDGWRLDVCDEIGHNFWRAFRKRIKSVNKDAIIIGEIMHEANSFLKGDQLDSIMNYPFKNAVTDFFAKKSISSSEFSDILAGNRMMYMDSITKQMWNLIDSHDTKRFLTECNDDLESMKLAVAFQFTYLGVPYIYYGDEIGINGGDDPFNRRCMIWDKEKQNLQLLEYFKKMIKIRKENKALIYGDYKELYCTDNIIAFERKYGDENILIIINNNDEDIKYVNEFEINGNNIVNGERICKINSLLINKKEIKIIRLKNEK